MKFIDPKNDIAFRKIFGSEQSHDILIKFLNAILDLSSPIQGVKVTIFFSYPLIKGLEKIILDMHASDQDSKIKPPAKAGGLILLYIINHFICYITCTPCKIASRPHSLSPILLTQLSKLSLQFI